MVGLSHFEPDYESAAQAWWILEATKLTLQHRDEWIALGEEYRKRADAEDSQTRSDA